jgi:hypothetical protein
VGDLKRRRLGRPDPGNTKTFQKLSVVLQKHNSSLILARLAPRSP